MSAEGLRRAHAELMRRLREPPKPEYAPEAAPPRRRKRRPTLASVARQVEKAGIEVARYEVDVDNGKIIIVPGKPEIAPTDTVTQNEWDTVQ